MADSLFCRRLSFHSQFRKSLVEIASATCAIGQAAIANHCCLLLAADDAGNHGCTHTGSLARGSSSWRLSHRGARRGRPALPLRWRSAAVWVRAIRTAFQLATTGALAIISKIDSTKPGFGVAFVRIRAHSRDPPVAKNKASPGCCRYWCAHMSSVSSAGSALTAKALPKRRQRTRAHRESVRGPAEAAEAQRRRHVTQLRRS